MALRRHSLGLSLLFAVLAAVLSPRSAAGQAAPHLVGAVSRLTHSTAGDFDVQLPLVGASGIECRQATALTIVFTFDKAVSAGSFSVTGGAAKNGLPTFAGNTMSCKLKTVADLQTLTITITGVQSTDGGTLASAAVGVRMLKGDINGDGTVTAADVNLCNAAKNAVVTVFNFRCDINHGGTIGTSDVNLITPNLGNTIAGGATGDTSPTIGTIADRTSYKDQATNPIGFAVNDAETLSGNLSVAASSDNTTLLPATTAYVFGGSDDSRTLTITPATGQIGVAHVTVKATDGQTTVSSTFTLTVALPPTLYVASMTPQEIPAINGTSQGSGQATLQLSGDETYALLRFAYSNLTTPEVSEHIHIGSATQAGDIIYDIDQNTPDETGAYRWNITVGAHTVAEQVAAIKSGGTYINVHTQTNPGGEIRGQFFQASGSQTFTPPPDPPPLPGGNPTVSDAARFLTQATFGPTSADITNLTTVGFDSWLATQFTTPATSMYDEFITRVQDPTSQPINALDEPRCVETFWHLANTGPDQLRQRVAFAYSQIFVVSIQDAGVQGQPPGLCKYWDMLTNDAFIKFYDPDPTLVKPSLLKDVTLHPIMGAYLDMKGNDDTTSAPNENYAREVLQLFTIGLNFLQPDGTLKLDTNGLPIPTYQQATVTQFAQVFTGWNSTGTVQIPYTYNPNANGGPGNYNFNSAYNNPMVVTASKHSTEMKTLLAYTLPNGQQAPNVINANGSQTNATSKSELDFAALTNIYNHPNLGPFFSRLLIQRLVESNPSPGYVYRVAKVFNDDGTSAHVRGNMQAVITAILKDYEARSVDILATQGYGHLREPVLRITNIVRAFHPQSAIETGINVKGATGGTYKLRVVTALGTQTTGVIAFNAPDSNEAPGKTSLQTILQGLTNVGTGNVTVSTADRVNDANGKRLSAGPSYTAIFDQSLGNVTLTLTANSLTGTTPTVVTGNLGGGFYKISPATTDAVLQTPLKSPSVFNFYSPDFIYPGAIAKAGLKAPELEIASETTNVEMPNAIQTGVTKGWKFSYKNATTPSITQDLSTELAIVNSGSSDPVGDLLDELSRLMMGNSMSSDMKARLKTYYNSRAHTADSDKLLRIQDLIYLVATSSQGAVEK